MIYLWGGRIIYIWGKLWYINKEAYDSYEENYGRIYMFMRETIINI